MMMNNDDVRLKYPTLEFSTAALDEVDEFFSGLVHKYSHLETIRYESIEQELSGSTSASVQKRTRVASARSTSAILSSTTPARASFSVMTSARDSPNATTWQGVVLCRALIAQN